MDNHLKAIARNENATLRSGVDADTLDTDGRTALSLAARRGDENEVKSLLKDGANPDSRDKDGRTPLSLAVEGRHMSVTKLLLDTDGVNPDSKDNNGRTPLSWAVDFQQGVAYWPWDRECTHEVVVRLLLETKGVDPNSRDNDGRTPLSHAAERGHSILVNLLLDKDGVDPDSGDNDGRTPLWWASEGGHKSVVSSLLKRDAVNPNSRDSDGRTPLLRAVQSRHEEVVNLLLNKDSVELDSKDKDGRTPLSWAVEYQWPVMPRSPLQGRLVDGESNAVVKFLLAKDGVDQNSKDNDGQTPLSRAIGKGYKDVVDLLLEQDGVDINPRDNDGRTPLWGAVEGGYVAIVKGLLNKEDIKPDSKENGGRTPLSRAAECGHEAIVMLLLNNGGVNPDSKDNDGWTPLSRVAEGGHETIVELLLERDAVSPNARDNDGWTPLSRAAKKRHVAIVRRLAMKDSVTLHMLVRVGNLPLVILLLKARYNGDTRDTLSRTPLHIAALFGQLDIARELISLGVDINSKDASGMTPLRLAIQRKHHKLISLLFEHSAQARGVTVTDWLDAYKQKASNSTVKLSECTGGNEPVCFIEGVTDQMSAEPGTVRRLFIFADFCAWSKCLISNPSDTLETDKSRISHQIQIHDKCVSISVAGCFPVRLTPIGTHTRNQKRFDLSEWSECGVAWTTKRLMNSEDGRYWKPIDHFSTLPYGWIPDNEVEFFTQFMQFLQERWLELGRLAEEHLYAHRLDQLRERGNSSRLIHHLAEDAQDWAELRSVLRCQVRTAREFAVEYCRTYNEENGLGVMCRAIDSFADEIDSQIGRLDQTVKDLLQFEFAWVSINEAHRSTSIATSIKRLSWITFIFLPAMFASSLFGMNVDILEANPDWRWYILFGGGSVILTILGWLLFKYGQIENLVEREIGARLERWSKSVVGYIARIKESRQSLPTAEQVRH